MSVQEQLTSDLQIFYASPASIQQVALDALDEISLGEIDISDATNPFMFLLESAATMTHAAMLKGESGSRGIYPLLAQRYDDLYHHMSDKDYLDRFAAPSKTVITVVFPIKAIINNAVTNVVNNVKKIVIPKDTIFKVGGYSWYVHRPIAIKILTNGVVQVSYDLSVYTPLVTGKSGVINYNVVNVAGEDELVIDIPVEQLDVDSTITPVSSSTGYSATYSLSDNFYYIRAFHKFTGGIWEELKVTHSDQVFDVTKPTLLVKVIEGQIVVKLPDIYLSTSVIGQSIRTDIYTTSGAIDVKLNDFNSDDFEGTWIDNNDPDNQYILPLSNLTSMKIFADQPVVGGKAPATFDELRERVIYRSADNRVSITFEELAFQMSDLGYVLSKGKDTITERLFIAARTLPSPSTNVSTSVIGVVHGNVVIDTTDVNFSDVIVTNGERKTITNKAIFKSVNGTVSLLTNSELTALNSLPIDAIPTEMNRNNYLYTPFYYVMDVSSDIYNARTYQLDTPVFITRSHIASNPSIEYVINTTDIVVSKINTGFRVSISGEGPSGVADVYAQLTYRDSSNSLLIISEAAIITTNVGFLVEFDLDSSLDIDTDNRIEISSFKALGASFNTSIYIDLISNFEILYYRSAITPVPSLMDGLVDFPSVGTYTVTTHETCEIKLGEPLPNLYTRARAIVVPPVYDRYASDVPALYAEDSLLRDVNGDHVWTKIPDPNNSNIDIPVFTVEYPAGTPILEPNGNPVLEHLAGDEVIDSNGAFTILEQTKLIWELSPVLLDARYIKGTASSTKDYVKAIPEAILEYINLDIKPVLPSLMARTELAFLPIANSGTVEMLLDGSFTSNRSSAISIFIKYLVSEKAYTDIDIRERISIEAKKIVLDMLKSNTLSMGDMVKRLMNNDTSNIISVDVVNPIGGYNLAVIQNDNAEFSIRSTMDLLSNGTLDVVDDFNVSFARG